MSRRIWMGLCLACLSAQALAGSDLAEVKAKLEKASNIAIDEIDTTPIDGLYEVISQGRVIYLGKNGRYLLDGDLIDHDKGTNLTENTRDRIRLKILSKIDDSDTIVFSPEDPKHTLTVFTDTTCGYCRKLHNEMPKLHENGIKVRYMMFPRAGEGTASARTLESIWCAENPQKAMDMAKSGKNIPQKSCDAPVKQHMDIAQRLGLRGTPFLITQSGRTINGYPPLDQLLKYLQSE